MTVLEMITEWRKGCSCGPHNPANCPDCTVALIDAIERKLIGQCAPLNPIGAIGPDGGGVIYNSCPVNSGGGGTGLDSGDFGAIRGGLSVDDGGGINN